MKKKLVVFAISNRGGGSETFLINFLKRFSILSKFEITCFLPEERRNYYEEIIDNVFFIYINKTVVDNPIKRLIYENITAKKIIKRIKPDIVFIPSESIPYSWKRIKCIKVTNVHSTIQVSSNKSFFTRTIRENYDYFIRKRSLKISDYIIFVSYLSLAEIKFKFAIDEAKTTVIYHGVNFDSQNDSRLDKYGDYILSVGDRYEHKNYDKMIVLFAKLLKMHSLNIKLIIIGRIKSSSVEKKLSNILEEYKLMDKVVLLDSITYNDIGVYYKNAKLYMNTSSWESFGITPLEAMSYSIPCIAFKHSALAEIYSDKLQFLDPSIESDIDMVSKLHKMITDNHLRSRYIDLGIEFAHRMNWDSSIDKYISFFERIEGSK